MAVSGRPAVAARPRWGRASRQRVQKRPWVGPRAGVGWWRAEVARRPARARPAAGFCCTQRARTKQKEEWHGALGSSGWPLSRVAVHRASVGHGGTVALGAVDLHAAQASLAIDGRQVWCTTT